MPTTIPLQATCSVQKFHPTWRKRHYIALLLGRNKKWTFQRCFLGKRTDTEVNFLAKKQGLYLTVSRGDHNEKIETYHLIQDDKENGGLKEKIISKAEALFFCRLKDQVKWFRTAVRMMWPPPEYNTEDYQLQLILHRIQGWYKRVKEAKRLEKERLERVSRLTN